MSSNFEQFKKQIDDAVGLIEHSSIAPHNELQLSQFIGEMVDTQSLLDRCDDVCKKHEQTKPTIRIIHHLACSGGSLLTECMSLMPNTQILNEIHPCFVINNEIPSTDISSSIQSLELPLKVKLQKELFVENIKKVYQQVRASGAELIIRDNSAFDYLFTEEVERQTIVELLSPYFNIVSIVLVRDPINTYASLKHEKFYGHQELSFETFCRRFEMFLLDYSSAMLYRFEALHRDSETVVNNICRDLNLPFNDSFHMLIGSNNFSELDSWQPTDSDCYNSKLETVPHFKEIEESDSYFRVQKLLKPKDRKLILIATMPRSGSTWLFNCVREIYKSHNTDFYSCWIEDYDPGNNTKIHIVKIHEPEFRLSTQADLVLTTRRDVRNVCVSLARMGWLQKTNKAIFKEVKHLIDFIHPFWQKRSMLEVEYQDILDDSRTVVNAVFSTLGFENEKYLVRDVAGYLAKLKSPKQYHKETLLHPDHRAKFTTDFTNSFDSKLIKNINQEFKHWFEQYRY